MVEFESIDSGARDEAKNLQSQYSYLVAVFCVRHHQGEPIPCLPLFVCPPDVMHSEDNIGGAVTRREMWETREYDHKKAQEVCECLFVSRCVCILNSSTRGLCHIVPLEADLVCASFRTTTAPNLSSWPFMLMF